MPVKSVKNCFRGRIAGIAARWGVRRKRGGFLREGETLAGA